MIPIQQKNCKPRTRDDGDQAQAEDEIFRADLLDAVAERLDLALRRGVRLLFA